MSDSHDVEMYADPLWSRLGSSNAVPERSQSSYQAILRAIGAFLDEKRASHVNLLEGNDGFIIRYQPETSKLESVMEQLSEEQLLSLSRELERKRKRRPFHLGHQEEPVGTGYENILRALGYELDQVEAYSLLIDELDEGLVVTYQYLRPTEGFSARKRMVILGAEALQSVVEDARSRREQRKLGILNLLAG